MNYLYFVITLPLLLLATSQNLFANYIWIEAEKPDNSNFTANISAGPRAEILSDGKWINQTFSKEDINAGKLGNGIELNYSFSVTTEGTYNLWLRIGYEFARSPIMWRLDDGNWNEISPNDLTQNLIELSNWCEIGWLNPTKVNLSKGLHNIILKADKPSSDGRFLLGLDAITFIQGDWQPEDKLKPNKEPDSEIDSLAKKQIFSFDNVKEFPERSGLSLNGIWQICRHDGLNMDESLHENIIELPKNPKWRGINVPSDIKALPELDMAHCVWYRCRVDVPKSLNGRSFFLDFSGTNWITTVIVNNKYIASHKSTRIPWKIDITDAIKCGQVNEIMINIKDVWYAIDTKYHNNTLNKMRNIPVDNFRWIRFVAPVYPSTKGDADGTKCGVTDPVSLIVSGAVYVSDVFIKTKVSENKIIAEYTLANTTQSDLETIINADIIFDRDAKIEKSLKSNKIVVPAKSSVKYTLEDEWLDPKLWFPDDDPANMYSLITILYVNDKPVDKHKEHFGFREISIDGKYIRVNGIRRNFWNLLSCLNGNTPEEMIDHFHKGNNRFERFSEDLGLRKFFGSRNNQLNWTDVHGIPGRLSTMIDGMFINYDLTNPITWENFREHIKQVILAYRNHPSIFFYSLENELILINGRLNYGHILDQVEMEAKNMVDFAKQLDDTRPYMLDGAGALKGNLLEFNNLHYPEPSTEYFPENAYTLEHYGDMGERWKWDRLRPLAMGETAFFSGKNAEHAWIGGDNAFLGRYEAKRAYAKYVRMLLEGYRWNDVAIICPWVGMDDFPECWDAMSPIAVFVREYDSAFFAGALISRKIKVFNDTFSNNPVEFSWSIVMDNSKIAGETYNLNIEPGFSKELNIEFTVPKVDNRTKAYLYINAKCEGEKAFNDVKELAFFPNTKFTPTKKRIYVLENDDKFSKSILNLGIKAETIGGLSDKINDGIVIISPNYITESLSISDEFRKYAEKGTCFICLEQNYPLTNPTYPIKSTEHQAYYTFPQGHGSTLLLGLEEIDFSNWSSFPTALKVWETKSARSWVACGEELKFSAMLEMPYDKGIIIASQLQIGANLEKCPPAQILLANAIKYCDNYMPLSNEVIIYAPKKPEMVEFLKLSGCSVQEIDNISNILNEPKTVIIHASKDSLEFLLSIKKRVDKFINSGGYIMLWGLEPEGLNAYNKLLGTEHLLREFRLEKVSIEKDILASGLGNRDFIQYTDEEIMHGDKWLSQEVFTYCVDGKDIAPFCKLPGQKDEPYRPTKDDHDPYNLVNGMTGQDFWRYILQIWHGNWNNDVSPPFVFELPVTCNIKNIKIWNNAYYNTIKDIEIKFDEEAIANIELPDAMMPEEVDLGGKPAKSNISLIIRSIRKRQDRHPLVGIDNIQIIRELPNWYQGRVFPLVNVGGLVRYSQGNGGFILNQIKITDQDTKENIAKKHRIAKIILENINRLK